MLILQGDRALSSFRIQSLIARAQADGIQIKGLTCTYLFFVMGEVRDSKKLQELPKQSEEGT